MTRRANWLAVVSSAILGLTGLSGCQMMNVPAGAELSGKDADVVARGAEPDRPQARAALELPVIEPARTLVPGNPADDPFAPITVDQLLPASSEMPAVATPGGTMLPSGYIAPPVPINVASGGFGPAGTDGMVPPMAPGLAPPSDMRGALNAGGSTCEGECRPQVHPSLLDNMVVFAGVDYFTNSGALNHNRLIDAAAVLGVVPAEFPDLDPQRTGGMLGINAGVPLTWDGKLGFQVGVQWTQAESGGQGFFTTGLFHRCDTCDHWQLNWGAVYDAMYDDFLNYHVGQVRLKFGYAVTPHCEVGSWLTITTNQEHVNVPILTGQLNPNPPPTLINLATDTIRVTARSESQAHFFWHHIFGCGADATVFVGGRGNLGEAFIVGGTAQIPIGDHWAAFAGGHWSDDADSIGSFDVYGGLALYPGGNARVPSACGSRYLPYQDVANDTFMSITIKPKSFVLEATGQEERL